MTEFVQHPKLPGHFHCLYNSLLVHQEQGTVGLMTEFVQHPKLPGHLPRHVLHHGDRGTSLPGVSPSSVALYGVGTDGHQLQVHLLICSQVCQEVQSLVSDLGEVLWVEDYDEELAHVVLTVHHLLLVPHQGLAHKAWSLLTRQNRIRQPEDKIHPKLQLIWQSKNLFINNAVIFIILVNIINQILYASFKILLSFSKFFHVDCYKNNLLV